MDNLCHCLSGEVYLKCCAPLHLGNDIAQSPEQLMRSRYCAFVLSDYDYIYLTHSPKTRHNITFDDIKQWSEQCEWLGLDIRHYDNNKGIVEFVAWYKSNNQLNFHHETSTFHQQTTDEKLNERLKEPLQKKQAWYYLDATYPSNIISMPKRNDLCICKSRKKYKKCCGS